MMKFLKDKKQIIIGIAGIVIMAFCCIAIINMNTDDSKGKSKEKVEITDAQKFKKEYEALNGVTGSIKTSIDENNPMVYSDYIEISNKINNKESFALYIGYSHCPWCRRAVPVLVEAANQIEAEHIYYINVDDQTLLFKDRQYGGEYDKEAMIAQQTLIELINKNGVYSDIESEYDEDEKGLRLYTPTVLFINNGEIVNYNVSTVEGHNSASDELTEEQYTKLLNIYLEGFESI